MRVDFVDTKLMEPSRGECKYQHLTVGGTVWPMGFEKICGINYDQHFYIEIDQMTTRYLLTLKCSD